MHFDAKYFLVKRLAAQSRPVIRSTADPVALRLFSPPKTNWPPRAGGPFSRPAVKGGGDVVDQ